MSAELIPLRPITTAEAPKQNISPSEIAAPFNTLSAGFEKFGDAAEATARKLAEDAGRDAVRTDDAGNLVVDKAPIIGQASQIYENAALTSGLAKIKPKIENDLLEMRLADPYNFDKFKVGADAYRTKLMAGIDNPHLRDAVGDIVATNSAHNWRTMRVEADQKNLTDFVSDSQATLKDITEKRASLARQGGVWTDKEGNLQSTPEFAGLTNDYQRIIGNLVADPRTKYSTERAALEIRQQGAADFVQMKIGEVQRQFMGDKDLPKAKQALANAFWGPGSEKFNLTATQRDHGVAEGVHALTNLSAIDHEAITEFRKGVAGFLVDMQTKPRTFDFGELQNMRQRAKDIGDTRSLNELDEGAKFHPLWSTIHSASPLEQSNILGELRRGVVPAFGIRAQGVDSNLLAVANRAAQISGIPFTIGDKGGVRDQATQDQLVFSGFSQTRNSNHLTGRALDLLPVVNGKPVAEGTPEQHAEIARAMKQAAGELGVEVGWGGDWKSFKDVAHFELPRGGTVNRAGLVSGQQIDLASASPTARLFQSTVKEVSALVSKNAEKAFGQIEEKAKTGATLLPDEVQHFAEMAIRSGRDDLIEKAKPWLAALDAAAQRKPGETAEVIQGQIAEMKAQGVDGVALDTFDHLQTIVTQQDRRLKEAPLVGAAERGWTAAPGALDFKNPQAAAAEWSARNKNIGVIQQGEHAPGVGAVSAIMPDEAPAFATALTTGDPKVAAQLLGGLQASLSPENWRKTMETDAVKNAVTGMANSNDPARMTAGMDALDKLWTSSAPEFENTYGGHALTRLLAWKGLQSLTPDQIVERLNKADDPFVAKGRAEVAEAAKKELESWKPQDVAYQLGTSWRIPLVSSLANPFTQNIPEVPADPVAAGAMAAQFKETAIALRTYSVDPDTAKRLTVERMRAQWQPSKLAAGEGNVPVLMRNAPETFYPQIDGSHDWMKRDLEEFVTKVHGPKFAAVATGGEVPMIAAGWSLHSIVADNQTDQEIRAGKPPSYRVHIVDAKGQDQFVRDPATGQDRIRWNPAAPQAIYQAKQRGIFDQGDAPYQTLGQQRPFMIGAQPLP